MKAQQVLYILIILAAINYTKLPASSALALRQASQAPVVSQAASWYPATSSSSAPAPVLPQESIIQITPEQIHTSMSEFQESAPNTLTQGQTSNQNPTLVEMITKALVVNYATSYVLPKIHDFTVKEVLFPIFRWWEGNPSAKTLQLDMQPKLETPKQPLGKQPTHQAKNSKPAPKGMLNSMLIKKAKNTPLHPYAQQMLNQRSIQQFKQELSTLQKSSNAQKAEFIRPEDIEILPPAPKENISTPHQVQPSMQQFSSEQELNQPAIPVRDINSQQTYAPATEQAYQPSQHRPLARRPLQRTEPEIELENPEDIVPINEAHVPETLSSKTPKQEPKKPQEQSTHNEGQRPPEPKGSNTRSQRNFALGLTTGITSHALSNTLDNSPDIPENNENETIEDNTPPADQIAAIPDTPDLNTSSWRDYLPSWQTLLSFVPGLYSYFNTTNPPTVTAEMVTPAGKTSVPQGPKLTPHAPAPTRTTPKYRPGHRPSGYEPSFEPSRNYPEHTAPSKTITRSAQPTEESTAPQLKSNQTYPSGNQHHPEQQQWGQPQEPSWGPGSQQMAPEQYYGPMYEPNSSPDFFNYNDQGYIDQGAHMGGQDFNNRNQETKAKTQPTKQQPSTYTPEFIKRDVQITTENQPFHRIKHRSVKQHTSSPVQLPTEQIQPAPSFWTPKTIITVIAAAILTIVAAVFMF